MLYAYIDDNGLDLQIFLYGANLLFEAALF